MKILLGTCLALLIAGGVPALASDQASHNQAPPAAQSGDNAAPQGADHQRVRHHPRHPRHDLARGDRVPRKWLSGHHVVTNYARFQVQPPAHGEQWVKGHGQLLLVSADGVVKTAIPRPHHHRHARRGDTRPADGRPAPSGSY